MQPPPIEEIPSTTNGRPVEAEICAAISAQGGIVRLDYLNAQAVWLSNHSRARLMAARVCSGAVPPIWLRLLIEPFQRQHGENVTRQSIARISATPAG